MQLNKINSNRQRPQPSTTAHTMHGSHSLIKQPSHANQTSPKTMWLLSTRSMGLPRKSSIAHLRQLLAAARLRPAGTMYTAMLYIIACGKHELPAWVSITAEFYRITAHTHTSQALLLGVAGHSKVTHSSITSLRNTRPSLQAPPTKTVSGNSTYNQQHTT